MLNFTSWKGKANQNCSETTTSQLLDWLPSIRQEIASVGEDGRKEETLSTTEDINWYSYYGDSSKIKNRSTV